MPTDPRIASCIKESCIERILLVDDAYDPPSLTSDYAGPLLELLAGLEISDEGDDIDSHTLDQARDALTTNDLDSMAIATTIAHLFARFCEDGNENVDPGGFFTATKGAALGQLRPLVRHLRLTMPDCVQTTGLGHAEATYADFGPELLLVDYYLDASSEPGSAPEPAAREASMRFLKKVVESAGTDMPSVVLMSSHNITDVDEYRHETDHRILSVRFGFLDNRVIHTDHRSPLRGGHADVILDACQGYRFGNLLQDSLTEWHTSVSSALMQLSASIRDLSVKDFAYLIRFRLRSESANLAGYLDWLFGENLRALTEATIPWSHGAFAQLDSDTRLEDSVEGALDGPTISIAKLFHRTRIGSRRGRNDSEYRLGDIYLRNESRDLRVVISPNCDLVMRPSGTSGTPTAKVPRVLTMGGTLYKIDSKVAVADELFIFDNAPHYIGWTPKDLRTFPIDGNASMHRSADYGYVGSLTPLYALKTQSLALADLSRIGLPVAPAFGVSADVRVWFKTPKHPLTELDPTWEGVATIVPRREGQDGHQVLLGRTFVNELLEKLDNLRNTSQVQHPALGRILGMHRTQFFAWLVVKGAELNNVPKYGTKLTFGKPSKSDKESFLHISLTTSDLALDSIRIADPLATTT